MVEILLKLPENPWTTLQWHHKRLAVPTVQVITKKIQRWSVHTSFSREAALDCCIKFLQ